jgi:hypothetical protein
VERTSLVYGGRGGGAAGGGPHERPQQWDEQPLRAGGVLGAKTFAHQAGVQSVGGDAGAGQPPRESQVVGTAVLGDGGVVVDGAIGGLGARADVLAAM